jgi:L-threonylcarbamoyladenylate synthase
MIKPVCRESIEEAASILRKGGLVAFPTETVYGLGANALDAIAVARIFEAKKRPHFDPLIVHAADAASACALWKEAPPAAHDLIEIFWPGPLTIVLPKKDLVPDIVTSGLPTVAVRVPSHPDALALLRAFGAPIAAPSANPFGRTSPTSARHVEEDLGTAVDLILDGGDAPVGVESTVVKIENGMGMILRPGGVSAEQLRHYIPLIRPEQAERGFESPGLLESHYAPRTRMVLFDRLPAAPRAEFKRAGLLSLKPRAESAWFGASEALSPSGDLREAAKNLFAAMRRLDARGFDFIAAERVAPESLGAAILDRLSKAASGKTLEAMLSA